MTLKTFTFIVETRNRLQYAVDVIAVDSAAARTTLIHTCELSAAKLTIVKAVA